MLFCRRCEERHVYGNRKSDIFDCDSVVLNIEFATFFVLGKFLISIIDLHNTLVEYSSHCEILASPNVMVITLNWQCEHRRSLSNDLEKLRSEHKQTCEADQKHFRENEDLERFQGN